MKRIIPIIFRIAPTFMLLISIYVGLMVLVYSIPNGAVNENINKSAIIMMDEGPSEVILPGFLDRYRHIDGFSDNLMVDMSLKPANIGVLESSMLNDFYCRLQPTGFPDGLSFAKSMKEASEGNTDKLELYRYGRCWNGYLIAIKPLLLIMDYSGMRYLNFVLFSFLVMFCLYLIWIKISPIASLTFCGSLLYFNFWMAPFCLQYMITSSFMLLCSIIVLSQNVLLKNTFNCSLLFFVIGSLIAFVDVFTMPYLTLGIPLIFYILQNKEVITSFNIILICVCWFLGYSFTWCSKFVLGSVLSGVDILGDAVQAAKMRTSTFIGDSEINMVGVLSDLIILVPVIIVVLFILPFYFKNRKTRVSVAKYRVLLLLIAIVPLWFILLSNHSFGHIFFTYRGWLLPVYGLIMYMYYTSSLSDNRFELGEYNKKK